MKPIYLDNNATTPVAPEVVAEMTPFLSEHFGNPSSMYRLARETRSKVEEARTRLAALLGAVPTRSCSRAAARNPTARPFGPPCGPSPTAVTSSPAGWSTRP